MLLEFQYHYGRACIISSAIMFCSSHVWGFSIVERSHQTGTLLPILSQNSHLFSKFIRTVFPNPRSTTTNSSPVLFTSGTPGCEAFVNLCASGSPVWKKLANAPAYPSYTIGFVCWTLLMRFHWIQLAQRQNKGGNLPTNIDSIAPMRRWWDGVFTNIPFP